MRKNNNKLPPMTHEELVANGRKGGLASAAARRERKTLAQIAEAYLAEATKRGLTRKEELVVAILKGALGDPKMADLVNLAKVLGELTEKSEVKGSLTINVSSAEDAEEVRTMMDLGNEEE